MLTLKRYNGSLVTPRDDALLYDFLINGSGIFEGLNVTHLGANQLLITAGRGMAKGRDFTADEETVLATLSDSGTKKGRLLIRIDLANEESPIQFATQMAATLPAPVQEDINRDGTVYELPLVEYNVDELQISSLVSVATKLESLGGANGIYPATCTKSGTVFTLAGLPATLPDYFSVRFKAPAAFAEGNTFNISGTTYTPRLTSSTDPMPDDAFVSGAVLTVDVDTVTKRVNFKSGGGGGEFNIFTQTTTPSQPDGLWIKSNAVSNVLISELAQGTATISEKGTVPYTGYDRAAGISGDICIVAGGYNGSFLKGIQAYSIPTNVGSSRGAELTTAMSSMASAAYDDFVFLFGGYGSSGGYYNYIQKYSVSLDAISTISSLIYGVEGPCSAQIGNTAYIFGGITSSTYRDTIQAFNMATGVRTTKSAKLAAAMYNGAAGAVEGICYIFGGRNGISSVQAYDPTTDVRTTLPHSVNISEPTCGVINNVCYIFYGSAMAYNPITGITTTLTNIALEKSNGTTCAVYNDTVAYVIGGSQGTTYTNVVREFIPASPSYPEGTAVVNLVETSPYKTTLFASKKVTQKSRIKDVLLQSAGSLNKVAAAIRNNNGAWTNIL